MIVTKQRPPLIESCITEGETEYLKSDVNIDGLNQNIVGLNWFMPNPNLTESTSSAEALRELNQKSKMKIFLRKKINGFKCLTFFRRMLHLDVWLGFECVSIQFVFTLLSNTSKNEGSN